MNPKSNENLNKIKNSAWSFFIRKRPVSILIVLAIFIIGSISAISLPRELQPEIEIPMGSIVTTLPGANPLDIETLITNPIEKEIETVTDIASITSNSSFGVSLVMIEFETGTVIEEGIQDLKDAVDRIKSELPDDASDPITSKIDANAYPVISFSVLSDKPISQLTEIAEVVQQELESINGVASVDLFGGQFKEIEVLIDKEKLEKFGLTILDLSNLIKGANLNLPIGLTQIDKLNYSIRIDNQFTDIEDIKNIPLFSVENEAKTTIFLKDIAKVKENYPTKTTLSRVSIEGREAIQAISLSVNKKKAGNIIEVAEKSRAKIAELKANGKIPSDIEFAASNDNSIFIKNDLGVLTSNGIQTTILIIIILFLALGLKEGLIAGLSIPLSFLIAFSVLSIMGMTINSLSLFSLVIALGLMVDTSIVIMEGIFENMKNGYKAKDAALLSVYTYRFPLIAGTMTTVFAFFPMLLVGGIMGEFLKTLPITISATLFGSLFTSLTISPAIAGGVIKQDPNKEKTSILEPIFKKVGNWFSKFINSLISKKRYRILTLITAFALFIASMALPITGMLKVEMFPKTDGQYFFIDVEIPKGMIIEETNKVVKDVEEYLYTIPEIDTFLTTVGQESVSLDLGSGAPSQDSNLANLTINLVEEDLRERRSYEITDDIRNHFKSYTKGKITVKEITEGPPSDSPINVRLTGSDFNELKQISEKVQKEIEQIPNTTNIRDSFNNGLNEFVFTLDQEKISKYGLNSNLVAINIRNIIQGVEADEITLNGEDLSINLRYNFDKNDFNKTEITLDEIQNFKFQTPNGKQISLSEIADFKMQESISNINHEEGDRIIKVAADVNKNGNASEITTILQEKLKNIELKPGYEIKFGGDFEQIAESFNDLFKSMGVAIILIAFTLVLMFNSFRQPFIILIALPLALIGVFPGLMLIGLALSFPAFLGVVALAGIVVNDAIVLIDRINENRNKGLDFNSAISEASNARLQPIFMTSLTTIVGILPLAITNEFWSGLGFSLIFGLICATGLTLIVMPVLYHFFERGKAKKLGQYK